MVNYYMLITYFEKHYSCIKTKALSVMCISLQNFELYVVKSLFQFSDVVYAYKNY